MEISDLTEDQQEELKKIVLQNIRKSFPNWSEECIWTEMRLTLFGDGLAMATGFRYLVDEYLRKIENGKPT